MIKKIIVCCCVSLAVVSCKVDPKIATPLPADNLVLNVPEGWPQPRYNFEENPITQDRFILGRALFYEPMLSVTNSISCGTCHQDFAAFANKGHITSHGVVVDGVEREGTRNSPGLFNLAWHSSFMYDGGSSHIELQPIAPITNTLEMAEQIPTVVSKLQSSQKYRSLFKSAYGDENITGQRLLKSLAQFMGLITSSNSKFDYYKRHEKNVQLSPEELKGYSLFQANCASCHKEPLFSDFEFRSNGLSISPVYKDSGRAHVTSLPQDRYKFKTPSLRNIALTDPYMHDGRFATLEQCLDHYTNPAKHTENLDPLLVSPLPLSPQDKKDIISFLHTLSDFEMTKDTRFADPNN